LGAFCFYLILLYIFTEIEYNLTYPLDWLNPQNWCTTDTETGPCKSVNLLDSETVPCATDNVVFLKDASYFVNLESGLELTVNTLKIINTVRQNMISFILIYHFYFCVIVMKCITRKFWEEKCHISIFYSDW